MNCARAFHSSEVKLAPLSGVTCSGRLKQAIQEPRSAWAQDLVVGSFMDVASDQRVEHTLMVKIYLLPSDGGRGPTTSTWMCPKCCVGWGRSWIGGLVWQRILLHWH